MKSWVEYWNSDHPIYVNARHLALHYRTIARDIAELVPGPDAVVLDFGCGEALSAGRVARVCRTLYLVDSAPTIREKLAARFSGEDGIAIRSPEEAATLPPASLDLVVIHSVAQYVPKDAFRDLLRLYADKLRPNGRILVGDVVPPDLSPLTDAGALLRFGWDGGFLVPAALGLVRTALSDYRKIRSQLGLSTYAEDEMLEAIAGAGLVARRLEKNLGHNAARMAFVGARL